jgi:hypothetical protein
MMQGRSAQFDVTIKTSGHTPVAAVNIIQDGKVVWKPPVISGSVTADRTAANMRTMTCVIVDPTGEYTPVDMNSLVTPYGTHIQMFKGARNNSVDTRSTLYGTAASWVPSGQSTGMFNGTKVSATGSLTLGP